MDRNSRLSCVEIDEVYEILPFVLLVGNKNSFQSRNLGYLSTGRSSATISFCLIND